jgi:hypothetical protein
MAGLLVGLRMVTVIAVTIGSVGLVWGLARTVLVLGAAITDWRDEQRVAREQELWRRRAERHRTWLEEQ